MDVRSHIDREAAFYLMFLSDRIRGLLRGEDKGWAEVCRETN